MFKVLLFSCPQSFNILNPPKKHILLQFNLSISFVLYISIWFLESFLKFWQLSMKKNTIIKNFGSCIFNLFVLLFFFFQFSPFFGYNGWAFKGHIISVETSILYVFKRCHLKYNILYGFLKLFTYILSGR